MSLLEHLAPRSVRLRQVVNRLLHRSKPMLVRTASAYRRILVKRTRFVVVVGSFGKTTTARAVSLGLTGTVHRHIQNNGRVWRSLAILRSRPWTRHTVVEVGINGPGQMREPATMLAPDIVVVTSIGSEHHTSLGALEDTRAEKAVMVEALGENGVAVLNGDDRNVMWMRSRTNARIVTFGRSPDCDVRLIDLQLDWPHGTRLRVRCGDETIALRTRLLGEKPQNAVVAALAAAWAEGLPLAEVAERLEQLEPTTSRLQVVPLANGAVLIRDEAKSNVETMRVALDALEAVPARRKICVFGYITEPQGSRGPIYREIGERIARIASAAVLLCSSKQFRSYRSGAKQAGMPAEAVVYAGHDVLEAIRVLQEMIEPGDVILVKGANIQRLRRISLALMGRSVGCAVTQCKLPLVDCDICSRLETGWGDRLTVP